MGEYKFVKYLSMGERANLYKTSMGEYKFVKYLSMGERAKFVKNLYGGKTNGNGKEQICEKPLLGKELNL